MILVVTLLRVRSSQIILHVLHSNTNTSFMGQAYLCPDATAMSYRLRTARQKKRLVKEHRDKQLIQLEKYRRELWNKERNLGFEPLIPPVQRGWIRTFELRDDVKRSKHADFFEGILKKINTKDYSSRKDFKMKKRKRGRKVYVERVQRLREPIYTDFVKLELTKAEQQFFYPVLFLNWRKRWQQKYVFSEPWRFVAKIRPHMITEKKIVDTELESEIQLIKNYIERNCLRHRMERLTRGRKCKWKAYTQRDHERRMDMEEFRNKPLTVILDEHWLQNE